MTPPQWARAPSFTKFLDHTQRHTTVGGTPLDEWSARRRDLYLTSHNTHNRQTSMPPVGFEPTISAGERPKTYVLDRAATGTGTTKYIKVYFYIMYSPACFDISMSSSESFKYFLKLEVLRSKCHKTIKILFNRCLMIQ